MRRAFLVVLSLAFAGCASPADEQDGEDSSPTETPGPTTTPPLPSPPVDPPRVDNHTLDPWNVQPELVGCDYYPHVFDVRKEEFEDLLPAGYEPTGGTMDGFANLAFRVHRCESVIVDNQTVIRGVDVALTYVRVDVNETLAENQTNHYYLFEFFVSNATLRDFFLSAGLPSILADFEIDATPGRASIRISVADELWYEVEDAGGVRRLEWEPTTWRMHHLPNQNPPVWMEFNGTQRSAGDLGPVVLRAPAGFLHQLPSAEPGLAGLTLQSEIRGTLRFVHL